MNIVITSFNKEDISANHSMPINPESSAYAELSLNVELFKYFFHDHIGGDVVVLDEFIHLFILVFMAEIVHKSDLILVFVYSAGDTIFKSKEVNLFAKLIQFGIIVDIVRDISYI